MLSLPARAEPAHGLSLGGTPKYEAGFKHFAYANPAAFKGGRLTLSNFINFDTLNPYSLKGRAAPLIGLVFETLTEHSLDEPFSEYGLVAQTIDVSADGKSVTFRIHPKARFSDGQPITAADVVYSLNVLRSDVASPLYRYYYADIDKAVARDVFPIYSDYRGESHATGLVKSVLEGDPYKIRGLIVHGASLLTSWPQTPIWRETLSKLDFMVCVDRQLSSQCHLPLDCNLLTPKDLFGDNQEAA